MAVQAQHPVQIPGKSLNLSTIRVSMMQISWGADRAEGPRIVCELVKSQQNPDGTYSDPPRTLKTSLGGNGVRTTVVLNDIVNEVAELKSRFPTLTTDPALANTNITDLIVTLTAALAAIAQARGQL